MKKIYQNTKNRVIPMEGRDSLGNSDDNGPLEWLEGGGHSVNEEHHDEQRQESVQCAGK